MSAPPRLCLVAPSRISTLARSFPTLADVEACEPFDPAALAEWTRGPAATSGGLHAARFLLSLWSGGNVAPGGLDPWTVGPFDAVAAVASWDDDHRAAFAAWIAAPWFP